MYGDAKGLCDKMWGDAFFYVDDKVTNNDGSKDFCMVMQFDGDGENPNNPTSSKWETNLAPIIHVGVFLEMAMIIISTLM